VHCPYYRRHAIEVWGLQGLVKFTGRDIPTGNARGTSRGMGRGTDFCTLQIPVPFRGYPGVQNTFVTKCITLV
jgi:hypothetical protein